MVWIVAYWHLCEYLGIDCNNAISSTLTHSVLATFTLFSGFFLGQKAITAHEFYKKRLLRFYPLFFLACLLMFIGGGGIKSFLQFLMSITGLSVFWLPQPPTLWYMAMLMVFYVITPPILHMKSKWNITGVLLIGFCVEICFCLVNKVHPIDEKVILYFPFYVAGLIIPKAKYFLMEKNSWIVFAFSLLAFLMALNYQIGLLRLLLGVSIILSLSCIIGKRLLAGGWVCNLFGLLSYASLSAYLFHRHVFKCFKMIFANEEGIIPVWYAPIMVVGVFAIAYFLQKNYDWILNKLVHNEKI